MTTNPKYQKDLSQQGSQSSSVPVAAAPVAAASMSSEQLRVAGISAGYGGPLILNKVDLEIPQGKVTALIGPNGCGKSTLLRVLGRQLKPSAGDAFLGQRAIWSIPSREFARHVAFLPQQPIPPDGLLVEELIAYGRYAYTGAFASLKKKDWQIVHAAAERAGVTDLLHEPAEGLSGGQQQRVWIAMTLAQDAPILLLDEPTTYLDPAYQLGVLELVASLGKEGRTVVMVLHDMSQAARFAEHVVAMHSGEIIRAGEVNGTLTEDLIKEIFQVDCLNVTDPHSGRRIPIPHTVMQPE